MSRSKEPWVCGNRFEVGMFYSWVFLASRPSSPLFPRRNPMDQRLFLFSRLAKVFIVGLLLGWFNRKFIILNVLQRFRNKTALQSNARRQKLLLACCCSCHCKEEPISARERHMQLRQGARSRKRYGRAAIMNRRMKKSMLVEHTQV